MKIISSLVVMIGVFVWMHPTYAMENTSAATYQLNQMGPTVMNSIDDTGENVTTSIEKIDSNPLISAGTYRITKQKMISWKVSFDITINSKEKITSAGNLSIDIFVGSMVSSSLSHNSTSATCKFKRKLGLVNVNESVIAKISKGAIVVT